MSDHAPTPAAAKTAAAQPATPAPTAAHSTAGGGTSTGSKRALDEGIEGLLVTAFEAIRADVAKFMLDWVPNAHLITAGKIVKVLPVLAVLFKIKTPEGLLFNVADEIAIDLARALNEEYSRRSANGTAKTAAPATVPTVPLQSTATPPVDGRARFMLASRLVLDDADFDDMIVWHRALSQDDQRKLDVLAANATNGQLDLLVKQRPSEIHKALSSIQLPPPKEVLKTFLEFRLLVAADANLTKRIKAFLKAKAVTTQKFWKALEHAYGTKVNDVASLTKLMSLDNDFVYEQFNLAPNALEVFSADLDAGLKSSGLRNLLQKRLKRANTNLRKSMR